ncbi:hypothetical protein PLICRDRAFT_180288 [Plicaturopsis crispa FD-325 SS-3]|uniref:Uncharacterized protein n=1 Tax=Plicaturopsis crispa FD-325 SS-3 TaxID=944288 RepID=A0A0C9T6H9_PLICR|nr:hypothetical protein PLICRDRAFT_180288 [Plicaturopsis crispa FD-325 SS-3]
MKTTSPPRTPPHTHPTSSRHRSLVLNTQPTHTHARHALHRPPSSSSHPLSISATHPTPSPPTFYHPRTTSPPCPQPGLRYGPPPLSTFLEDRVCVPSRENKPGRWQTREGIGKRRAHPPTHHSASDAPAVPDPGTTGANDAAEQVAAPPCLSAITALYSRAAPSPAAYVRTDPTPAVHAHGALPRRALPRVPERVPRKPPQPLPYRVVLPPPPPCTVTPPPPLPYMLAPAIHICAAPTPSFTSTQPTRMPRKSAQSPLCPFTQAHYASFEHTGACAAL